MRRPQRPTTTTTTTTTTARVVTCALQLGARHCEPRQQHFAAPSRAHRRHARRLPPGAITQRAALIGGFGGARDDDQRQQANNCLHSGRQCWPAERVSNQLVDYNCYCRRKCFLGAPALGAAWQSLRTRSKRRRRRSSGSSAHADNSLWRNLAARGEQRRRRRRRRRRCRCCRANTRRGGETATSIAIDDHNYYDTRVKLAADALHRGAQSWQADERAPSEPATLEAEAPTTTTTTSCKRRQADSLGGQSGQQQQQLEEGATSWAEASSETSPSNYYSDTQQRSLSSSSLASSTTRSSTSSSSSGAGVSWSGCLVARNCALRQQRGNSPTTPSIEVGRAAMRTILSSGEQENIIYTHHQREQRADHVHTLGLWGSSACTAAALPIAARKQQATHAMPRQHNHGGPQRHSETGKQTSTVQSNGSLVGPLASEQQASVQQLNATTTTTTTTTTASANANVFQQCQQAAEIGIETKKKRQNNIISKQPHNLQHNQQAPAQQPKTLPNNTLLEDLSRCHQDLSAVLWPRASQATRACFQLLEATCLPSFMRLSARKQSKKRKAALSLSQEHQEPKSTTIISEARVGALEAAQNEPVAQRQLGGAPLSKRTNNTTSSFPMPEQVRCLNTSLRQEDYERALRTLTRDVRFKLHIMLYSRVQTIWTLLTTIFCILIPVIMASSIASTATLVTACALLAWLGLQLTGALLARNFRKKLDQMLEKAVAQANSYFMDYNLMLGVINVGGLLTKSRLCVPMLYFDTTECREQIESTISVDCEQSKQQQQASKDADSGRDKPAAAAAAAAASRQLAECQLERAKECRLVLDYSKFGLPERKPTGGQGFAFAQSQLAKKILLRYSQRWISYFDKRKLMFNDDETDEPRHLSTGKCLCQFIEEHFRSSERRARHGDQQQQSQFAKTQGHDDGEQQFADDDDEEDEQFADGDDCCSTDELTDMLESKQISTPALENQCIQIDIGKLGDFECAHSLRIYIPEARAEKEFAPKLRQLNAKGGGNYFNCNALNCVPTLSQLVSQKELACRPASEFERTQSISPVNTEFSSDEQSTGVDIESPLVRNDELMRKLKELLERRKKELSTAPAAAGYSSQPPSVASRQQQAAPGDVQWASNPTTTTTTSSNNNNKEQQGSAAGPQPRDSSGGKQLKRFFTQTTDGLSSLTTGKLKQNQQGFYVQQQQQALEIC